MERNSDEREEGNKNPKSAFEIEIWNVCLLLITTFAPLAMQKETPHDLQFSLFCHEMAILLKHLRSSVTRVEGTKKFKAFYERITISPAVRKCWTFRLKLN